MHVMNAMREVLGLCLLLGIAAAVLGVVCVLGRTARAQARADSERRDDSDEADEADEADELSDDEYPAALVVHVKLASNEMPTVEEFDRWRKLEDGLAEAVESRGIGHVDGNELGGGTYSIFILGDDLAAVEAAVVEHLRSVALPPGSYLERVGKGDGERTLRRLRVRAAD